MVLGYNSRLPPFDFRTNKWTGFSWCDRGNESHEAYCRYGQKRALFSKLLSLLFSVSDLYISPDTGRTVCATIHQPSSTVFEMFDDLLLLKKGGNVVFFGELGKESVHLIDYFESRGANPIKYGENPAAWMLTCYSGEHAENSMLEWGLVYKQSKHYEDAKRDIAAIQANADESKKIAFDEIYVTTPSERLKLMISRLYRIYMRSPAYNLARLMIAIFYSFIIGSVFLQGDGRRNIWKESELTVRKNRMLVPRDEEYQS